MKKKIIIIIFIVTIMMIFPTFASDEISSVSVVIDNNYPPFSFINSENELVGITIDQWNLFEKKTGIDIEIVGMDWVLAQEKMNNGEFDVIDTIFKSEIREKIYDFTNPYVELKTSIFFHNNISGIVDLSSAKGFPIASKKGGYSVTALSEAGIKHITLYDNYEEMVLAASNEEIIMFIMEQIPASYFLNKYEIQNEFNYTEAVYSNSFYRAVHKGNSELVNKINNGFDLISDDEYKAINEKWLGKSFGISEETQKMMLFIAIGLIIIVIMLVLVNIFLKKQVIVRTKELNNSLTENINLNQKLNALLKSVPDMMIILDNDGLFMDTLFEENDKYLYKKEEFINKSFYDLFPKKIANGFKKSFDKFIETNETIPFEYNLKEMGIDVYYELRFSKINDESILGIVRNITEQKKSQNTIYEMSIKDTLTGLFNRNYFEKLAKKVDNKKENYGVMICDVDGLKLINDTLGHIVGDEYLKDIASAIKNCFVEDELVARIGGDEFVVIIKNTSLDKMEKNKQEIKNLLKKNKKDYSFLNTNISIGYSLKTSEKESIINLLKEADHEMYMEKVKHRYGNEKGDASILMKMLIARNFETGEHVRRIEKHVVLIANKLGMKESLINRIVLLGEFHDIGKIGISDQILLKPSKLTLEEYEKMKKHSEIGYRIAKSLPDIEHISELIYRHQEWYNGEGYPFGLSGKDIPIECRILSVVDAYDAMTNDRPYREAMTHQEAIDELLRFKGIQFDPVIVDLFIQILMEIK